MVLPSVISLEHVSMRRGGATIIDDISWQVAPRAHTAIIGANGSGKTSLLKLVTAYEWATGGAVEVLGCRLGHVNVFDLRKRIGWATGHLAVRIPRGQTAFDVALSGLEASIGIYREIDEKGRRHAREALHAVRAGHLENRTFETMSQGERQRTLIARALAPRPELLILDEPCAGLDPAARDLLLNDLAALAGAPNAPTILMVVHHVEEIAPWFVNVLVLKAGRVLAEGAPEAVLTSACMRDAFDWPCEVVRHGGRYALLPSFGQTQGMASS